MSKKPGNKETRKGVSTVGGDGNIDAATSAVFGNPPAEGTAAKRKTTGRRKAASRHKPDAFSAWLDRTLPRLQEQLADVVNINVTAPIDKIKN